MIMRALLKFLNYLNQTKIYHMRMRPIYFIRYFIHRITSLF